MQLEEIIKYIRKQNPCMFLPRKRNQPLGHSHPKLVNAIKQQAEKLIHCSNLYYILRRQSIKACPHLF